MTSKVRKILALTVLEAIGGDTKHVNKLARAFTLNAGKDSPELHIKLEQVKSVGNTELSPSAIESLQNIVQRCDFLQKTNANYVSRNHLVFPLDNSRFVKQTLSPESSELIEESKQKVIVEFSSPNIAKPFHVGHLRSTIIGNVISNLHLAFGHDVTRINYLGDWGTQFGLLKLGMDLANLTEAEVKTDPIKHFSHAYVNANKLAQEDKGFYDKALKIFCNLENGDESDLKEWNVYRQHTVKELTGIYQRLGITFDEYAWESEYRKQNISECLSLLARNNHLQGKDGKQVIRIDKDDVTLLKSDGSTMYLTRDIAAIMDRQRRHNFDKMIYVVENGQSLHFSQLFEIAKRLKIPNADKLQHVKFGRINKMSTRKGTAVFLKDILDEARSLSEDCQLNTPTTKIDVDLIKSHTADILGCSAIIINELKRKRMANYDFDWATVLQVSGDTGTTLHLNHSRLCNLKEITGVAEAELGNADILHEAHAKELIFCIACFPQVLLRAKDTMEPCVLVQYSFQLIKCITRALKVLRVKTEPDIEVQKQRMLLFGTARRTLHRSMTILGLKPLEKM